MRTTGYSKAVVGLSLLGLGARAWRPTKTVDYSNNGADCDPSSEHFMRIEALNYHDRPKFTMRWRQTSGPCGAAMDDSDLASWEAYYDGSTDDSPDHPPSLGTEGRVKLDLFVCSPYGEYELDLNVESFNDEGTTRWTRIVYEIKNGEDEYLIWDTLFSHLAEDPEYAPTEPGEYTWPLEGATGYYKTFYAGPLPPTVCENSLPSGTELVGCFEDSGDDPLLGSDTYVLSVLGEDGMTAQICSDFCSDYDFFGLESASECYCGTADEFENAVSSEDCGTSYPTLCTGDATTACGGFGAISVYQRTGDAAPAPAPTPTAPAPSPSPTITSTGTTFSLVGCFADDKTDRIMGDKMVAEVMSAEICHQLCSDGINTHFGTQYAEECWCGVDPDLIKNGEELELDECDMPCVGTASGELCGGNDKITAFKIEDAVSEYLGCFADTKDSRAMDAEGKLVSEDMTNEICISYCVQHGHSYSGTQYSEECWCGDASYDIHGEVSNEFCSYPCDGNADTMCGGFYAISVYSTAV